MHDDQETDPHPVDPTPAPEPEPDVPSSFPPGLAIDEAAVWDDLHTAVTQVMVEAQKVLEGRYKSIAVTHLETALMFFDKAIEVDGVK